MSEEDVIFNLDVQNEKAQTSISQVIFLLYRALGLWNRICRLLGLPDDSPIMVASRKIQQLTMVARQLYTANRLLTAALVPGAGVLSFALAGIAIANVAVSTTDFMMDAGA